MVSRFPTARRAWLSSVSVMACSDCRRFRGCVTSTCTTGATADTHGFGILNRLRVSLPHARSFLMDRETLEAHRRLWGREPAGGRYTGDTSRLTAAEHALYCELLSDRLGERIRLEQERIGFGWLQQTLARLP
ncbi:MAG: DUF2220 domain-containing protein [Woeseiaceae bacterium]|nr:DUF2220 domain-containing protein [Woeseiaceae bacterium]